MFDGKPPKRKPVKPFFLATGKTGRDYKTFLEGCIDVNAEVRIIGPPQFKPLSIPPNVKWIDSSNDPPDQAIDYLTLKEWYAQCTAVCIPLTGDREDTCGYTNLLEAMAMAKPVIMTKSGCLHLNPEKGKFGFLIDPMDAGGWVSSMNALIKNVDKAEFMGKRGRDVAEKEFSIERFNKQTVSFIEEIIEVTN